MKLLFFFLLALNVLAFSSAMGWLGHQAAPRGEPERISNQLNPQLIVLEPGRLQNAAAPQTAAAPSRPPASPPSDAVARVDRSVASPPTPAPAAATSGRPEQPPASSAPVTPAAPPQIVPAPPPVVVAPPAPPAPPPAAPSPPPQPMACVAFDNLRENLVEQLERSARGTTPTAQVSRTLTEPASGWWVRIPPAANREAADQRATELRLLGITDLFVVREAGPDQHAISLGLFRTEAAARQHLSDLQQRRINDASVTRRTPARYRVELRGPANLLPQITRNLPAGSNTPSNTPCRP